jgi:glycosyltransferase involved in cell wall biosynthesis
MTMTVGIIADEFFSRAIGRMGGFGWAARQVTNLFNSRPGLGVRVVFLAARTQGRGGASLRQVNNTPIVFRGRGQKYRKAILQQGLDLLLTIDYRPRYRSILEILQNTPVIVWVRDPRPPQVQEKVATLRLPHPASAPPEGIKPVDCRSVSILCRRSIQVGRPFLFGTPAQSLGSLLEGAYGVSGVECASLPNIVNIRMKKVTKSETPCVIFLGRLDPIKRPWLFVELARAFPAIEFLMLGQPHFRGGGAWTPTDMPPNIKLLGHVDGDRKLQLLSSAWVLVNTSIHEALPTSFLEALACETPLLSGTNVEGVVSRFGIFAGWWSGDGMAGLPMLARGLGQLIENKGMRTELGREGRRWVERTHSPSAFLSAFDALCARAGIHRESRRVNAPHAAVGTVQGVFGP